MVEAIGHQWWFEFRYPHPDNDQEEVVSANEMHIPVGEAVNLKLDSVDVIHSFWIPKLAGKVDMIPNNENTMWIQPTSPVNTWVSALSSAGCPTPTCASGSLRRAGPTSRRGCGPRQLPPSNRRRSAGHPGAGGVHVYPGGVSRLPHYRGNQGAGRDRARPHALRQSRVFRRVHPGKHTENLRKWLEDPEAMKPGNIMAQSAVYADPDRALTEPEISALIAYMSSLKAPPPSEATPTPTATRTPECVDDDIRVSLQDPGGSGKYVFGPSDLTFPAGETVTICIKAETEFHTFTVDDLGIDVSVGGGTTETLTFTFDQPGTFELICIPHEALGMKGTITVR